MTNRNTRRTLTIAAMLIVVLAAVGTGFYLLGRSTATPQQGTPTAEPPSPAGTSSLPTYAPTDVNGSPEPALPRGSAMAGQGGSRSGPDGLPLGYTHDPTGAVNAATNYLMWMNSDRIVDKPTADAMATSAASNPASRASLISSFDQLRTGMKALRTDQPDPARGAYAIVSYSTQRALIYIWAPEVTTDSSGQTDHLWATDAVQLVWSGDDWKLGDALVSQTGAAAVEPNNPSGNPSSEEKHSILTRTPADPGEISDSADQSWFEYGNAPH